MLLKRVNCIAGRFLVFFHIQADKEEEKMQDRMADFENLTTFPELAWKI